MGGCTGQERQEKLAKKLIKKARKVAKKEAKKEKKELNSKMEDTGVENKGLEDTEV